MRPYTRLGFIGRFRPLHIGGERAIRGMLEHADEVIIGVGSANVEKYNADNPFTAAESVEMLKATFADYIERITFFTMDDYAHIPGCEDGKRWAVEARKHFGDIDAIVTGNEFVRDLLGTRYHVIHPSTLVPRERWVRLSATDVRYAMARNEPWEHLVPEAVGTYIKSQRLDDRLRREFGTTILERTQRYQELYKTDPLRAEREKAART